MGQDFRSSYQHIVELRSVCSNCPILALTATATQSMVVEILCALNLTLTEVELVAVLPDRPNITLRLQRAPGSTQNNLQWRISDMVDKGDSCPKTLIYARTIDQATQIFGTLAKSLKNHLWVGGLKSSHKTRVDMYHGCTETEKQNSILRRFTSDNTLRVVVATVAFGMGVDVRDVDIVVHWGPSASVLSYWQETGRCARDGRQGTAILYIPPRSLHPKKVSSRVLETIKRLESEKGCIRKAFLTELFVEGISREDLDSCSQSTINCCNHCIICN